MPGAQPATDKQVGDMAPHVSLDGTLRFVTDVCGEANGREMARRIGFSIASGNGAHLKNWSLLWGNKTRPTLAPCYDLLATISWGQRLGWDNPERPEGPSLALRVGGEHRFARLMTLPSRRMSGVLDRPGPARS